MDAGATARCPALDDVTIIGWTESTHSERRRGRVFSRCGSIEAECLETRVKGINLLVLTDVFIEVYQSIDFVLKMLRIGNERLNKLKVLACLCCFDLEILHGIQHAVDIPTLSAGGM